MILTIPKSNLWYHWWLARSSTYCWVSPLGTYWLEVCNLNDPFQSWLHQRCAWCRYMANDNKSNWKMWYIDMNLQLVLGPISFCISDSSRMAPQPPCHVEFCCPPFRGTFCHCSLVLDKLSVGFKGLYRVIPLHQWFLVERWWRLHMNQIETDG